MVKGKAERIVRAVRLVYFVVTMLASLLVVSAPVVVAVGDVTVAMFLASKLVSGRCYEARERVQRYGFRSSVMDVPAVSIVRSMVIMCIYSLCDGPALYNNLYLGMTTLCSFFPIPFLIVKACLFTPSLEMENVHSSSLIRQKQHLKESSGTAALFISSFLFTIGHVVAAYRTTSRERRRLLFHKGDHEAVLACMTVLNGCQKVSRSPIPYIGKNLKCNFETESNCVFHGHNDLPINLLTDVDSFFISCQGLNIHYKISTCGYNLRTLSPSAKFFSNSSSPRSFHTRVKVEKLISFTPISNTHTGWSLSDQLVESSLYAPLLDGMKTAPICHPRQMQEKYIGDAQSGISFPSNMTTIATAKEEKDLGVVLVHGFGGGSFSWRHVMGLLAQQSGCTVVAFDRPGWGLTSRLHRKEWEGQELPNPYKLESQVDLLLSFCSRLGFSSVVLVGHDDGGLLALKTAERVRISNSFNVEIKGIVLLSVSLSRQVIPAFARILLHTSLREKLMVRTLLRAEITQVINRNAWFDTRKLTPEVLNLYKASLFVEGWEEAVHEIGRHSYATVLSPQSAAALLKSIEDLPVMIIVGAEDALVSLTSAQTISSKFLNSGLVTITGCGHLPHEECPMALIAVLLPFITRLNASNHRLQRQ